jgi:hypothetical protein
VSPDENLREREMRADDEDDRSGAGSRSRWSTASEIVGGLLARFLVTAGCERLKRRIVEALARCVKSPDKGDAFSSPLLA